MPCLIRIRGDHAEFGRTTRGGAALSGQQLAQQVAAGQGWFLYGLSRQNGRILARLDNLEQRIRIGACLAHGMPAVRARGPGPPRPGPWRRAIRPRGRPRGHGG